jgi:hypothetical protein
LILNVGEVDGTGSESSPVVGFDDNDVKTSGCGTRNLLYPSSLTITPFGLLTALNWSVYRF